MKVAGREKTFFSKWDAVVLCAFFISFLQSALTIVFLVVLLIGALKNTEGCVKGLLLATTRGVISLAVGAPFAGGSLKLIFVLLFSLLIFYYNGKFTAKEGILSIVTAAALFAVYTCLASLATSSYPITAMFKVVSFLLPFTAMLKGIMATREYPWKEYFLIVYGILFAISFVLIPFDRFRLTNDDFQGVFNHVNICGIIGALFIAVVLHSDILKRKKFLRTIIFILTLVMIYLSASRTGMFSALFTIAAYYIFSDEKKEVKFLVGTLILIFFLVFLITSQTVTTSNISKGIYEFVYKNESETILQSREELMEIAKAKYNINPLFGAGFMVPYHEGVLSFALRFNLIVEPGNVFWSVLGDTGIIGLILFAYLLITILLRGKKKHCFLLVAAISINMGEMVFFSSNNMAVLVYMLIGLYIAGDLEQKTENNALENKLLQ